ncbi:MAG: recombinase family protein [Chloroflexi bacterium]|nr:recombinase family protein [Chloroflexota bacterium]
MANYQFFKPAFEALATDGVIGDPNGRPAYAYIRVSSDGQAEEGRSGLPRQLEHIHEIACKLGYRISWEDVYADDHSGFEFEDRPGLTKLRQTYKSPNRRCNFIVMEHIDRLSREARWHQGFLEHEMKTSGLQVVYWKPYSSQIERAVMGIIAQEGMEQAIERMRIGTIKKAESGRVTAKRPAFGYRFVDGNGNENTMEARHDTYYAINNERAIAVRFIFESIAYGGMSCFELMKVLDERGKVEPGFRSPIAKAWNQRSLVKLIRNPLYKGEFIANRFYKRRVVEVDENGLSKSVLKEYQRPEEEWIRVSVSSIVDETTWELANRNLWRNKGFARRNKKNDYMLTSIARCATCGWRYHGHTDSKKPHIQRYYCSSIHTTPGYREHHPCDQPSIHCDILDTAVWEVIANALLEPEVLLLAVDARYSNDRVENIYDQLSFLRHKIEGKTTEEEKLYQAYLAGAFDASEYAGERQRVIKERDTLLSEYERLQAQVMTPEELAEKKHAVVQLVQNAQDHIDKHDAPLKLKQRIVRLLVDEILLNVKEGWFELRGTIDTGMLFTQDSQVAGTSAPLRRQNRSSRPSRCCCSVQSLSSDRVQSFAVGRDAQPTAPRFRQE